MDIKPNTEEFEREILINESGFREYDARWLYPQQINLRGVQRLGESLGHIINKYKDNNKVVVGHDYREYSTAIKLALINGLLISGCNVLDIGLALSPVAYFAQHELDADSVAMVTASHNENGWTGVKMGIEKSLTFGPDLMLELKELAISGENVASKQSGNYEYIPNIKDAYLKDLLKDGEISRKLKVVVACGNGTAGAYAPEALKRLGCEIIPMHCDLDYNFPNHNPNPEDISMLHALSHEVTSNNADIGFAFDGDGDRCGIVDNLGEEIFSDKIGVILARHLSKIHSNKTFVVDVKSTGLYNTDEELISLGAKVHFWKTGHSYIKKHVNDLNALAGFEKSGHFFFNKPIGRGYDDGILTAVTMCRLLDLNKDKKMSDLKLSLPKTWSSPTMSPFCPDHLKYDVIKKATAIIEDKQTNEHLVLAQRIIEINTINGIRFTLEDGTWGLIRASSNKPSLVVVVESPKSEEMMKGIFGEINKILSTFEEVGEYDQQL